MSRVGKKPITIPEGTKVTVDGKTVTVSASQKEIKFSVPDKIKVRADGDTMVVERTEETKNAKSLHGSIARILQNAIKGVSEGWSKTLELVGTGYRAKLEGTSLVLSMGFSHPVRIDPPEGISFVVGENKITVSGVDRHLVGQVAANVRQVRPPEPYKGKGIKYEGEVIRRKAGKAAKTGPATGE